MDLSTVVMLVQIFVAFDSGGSPGNIIGLRRIEQILEQGTQSVKIIFAGYSENRLLEVEITFDNCGCFLSVKAFQLVEFPHCRQSKPGRIKLFIKFQHDIMSRVIVETYHVIYCQFSGKFELLRVKLRIENNISIQPDRFCEVAGFQGSA